MGPRLDSRGNTNTGTRCVTRYVLQWGRDLIVAETVPVDNVSSRSNAASMGPRLDSRGNRMVVDGVFTADDASMGPRLDSRGNAVSAVLPSVSSRLQWGRDLIVAETTPSTSKAASISRASMGPRLDSRGNQRRYGERQPRTAASMGPRLDSRGNLSRAERLDGGIRASMGPRLDSRGNRLVIIEPQPRRQSFNGAAT